MTASPRTHVLLLYGGRSSEHSISCISAGSVLRALDPARYRITAVGIDQRGAWRLGDGDPDRLRIVGDTLPVVGSDGPDVLPPVAPGNPFLVADGSGGWQPLPPVDVVFPVLHGPYGEDGTIQGILDIAGVPYVGSGVFASAAAMDKGHAKASLSSAGLLVGRWVAFTHQQWQAGEDALRRRIAELGYPVFVKPCRAGSSVGVAKVSHEGDLAAAVIAAAEQDPRLIVEAGVVDAQEIECGVLVGESGEPQTSVCAEIRVRHGHDFYDFTAKYLDDSVDLIVPADLPADVEHRVRSEAVRAFQALGCEGLARVDFFVTSDGNCIVNEVNTMPGFTPISMYPRMWDTAGVAYPELVDRLIADALRRGTGLRP